MAYDRDRVSLRDIFEAVNELEKKITTRMDKQDEKIDSLEKNQSRAYGALGVLSLFFSSVAAYVWNKIIGD